MAAPTPRKKPAPKKTPVPTEVPVATLAYTVHDDVVHYTTKAGIELAVDLDFPAELLQIAMGKDDEGRSEEEQFDVMARTFGSNFEEAYKKMGILERRRLQRAIFTEFAKAMSMPLGESVGSSDS